MTPKERSRIIEALKQIPQYQVMLKEIASLAPQIPPYNYRGASNIEEIKFKLAQLELHRLVMTMLTQESQQ